MREEKNIPEEDLTISNKHSDSYRKANEPASEQTLSPQPQISETMEVHHHGHVRHQRKWKEYLFQFLMLFLAVFCGFLAEYQLEHKIEKNREKQFMHSMVDDLKADTASLTNHNRLRDYRFTLYDSLSKAIIENTYAENGSSVYFWGRAISRRIFFFSADGTMQQLKNAGGLRLISVKYLSDKIVAYDVLYRTVLRQQELEEAQMIEYRQVAGKIFDASVFKKIANLQAAGEIKRPEGNPQLIDNSPVMLNEITNKLNYWAANAIFLRQLLEQLKTAASNLIELIKKEYHVE